MVMSAASAADEEPLDPKLVPMKAFTAMLAQKVASSGTGNEVPAEWTGRRSGPAE